MALELSTAGIALKYAFEASAGSGIPSSGFVTIPGVKSIPSFNPEPNNLEVTDLSDTEWKRYIPGLKDPGGAIGITVNHYSAFRDAWETMLTAYATASASGKAMYIEIAIPNEDSFYFGAIPSALGFNGAEVDSVLENVAYLTPNTAPIWDDPST